MMSPQISVIVTVYNTKRFLARCVESVLSQTFTDFELLLIDDGSTDGSGKICDVYAEKDSRVRVFHKENGGVASARQLGVDNAVGVYSIHVDADDWVEENMLERMYLRASKAHADVVIADFFSDRDGQSIYMAQKSNKELSSDILDEILVNNLLGALWDKLIRHSLYKEYNVHFFHGIDYGEDVLVLAQLFPKNLKVIFLHEAFYHYNGQNPNSITRAYDKKVFNMHKQYVGTLKKLLPARYKKAIAIVAFHAKVKSFYHGFLTKDDFCHYMPTSLHTIIFYRYGKMLKFCMLLSYFGFFCLSKKIWTYYKRSLSIKRCSLFSVS